MKLASLVKKLPLGNNSILLIKEGSPLARLDVLSKMGDLIRQAGYHNIILIVANDLDDIQVASDEQATQIVRWSIRWLEQVDKEKKNVIRDSAGNNGASNLVSISDGDGDSGPTYE